MLNVPPGAVVSFKVAVKDGNANSAGAAIVQELNIINSNGQSLPRNDPLKNNLGGKLGQGLINCTLILPPVLLLTQPLELREASIDLGTHCWSRSRLVADLPVIDQGIGHRC